MGEKWKSNKFFTLFLIAGAVYFFLRFLFPLIAPVVVAVLIVVICNPLLHFMRKKLHIRKQYVMTGIMLILAALLGLLVWGIFAWLYRNVPYWVNSLDLFEEQFCTVVRKCCQTVEDYMGLDAVYIENVILEQVSVFIDDFQVQTMPDILSESWGYAKNIGALAGFFAVMFISVILLAKDYDAILTKISETEGLGIALEVAERVLNYIGTFLKAQLVIMLIIGLTCGITLWLFKMDYGFLWGLLAGLLDALPFIGTGIVLIPMAVWQLINGYVGKAVCCVILYAVCALIRECLEPKLIGEKIGVYPIAILISIYAGIGLFGLAGVIKGPLGFIIIYQLYLSIYKIQGKDKKTSQDNYTKI